MKGVIYVGAHYGENYEGYVSEGAENFIFFEPVMKNFRKLSRIMNGKEGVVLHNTALGDTTGTVRMFTEYEHDGKSCSILEPYLHLKQYPDIEFKTMELVNIDRLDNIEYDRKLYDHLHIDTQGYELEVLKGGTFSLQYIDSIQVEVYREELYKGCPMFEEVKNYLKDFSVESIYWCGLSWGNAKFIRKCV